MNIYKTIVARVLMLLALLLTTVVSPTPAYAAEAVKIGVLAYRSKPQTLAQWQPLVVALKQAIPERDFAIEALDHAELEMAVASRQLDFVLTNPGNYVLLSRRNGLSSPLATLAEDENGQPVFVFGGVIFVRAGQTEINSLDKLRGKTIAVATTDSLGGYQMQEYELIKAGVRLPQDVKLLLTGMPHDNVVEAVMAGRADVGFVRSGVLEDMAREGKLNLSQLTILNQQNLPHYPVQVSTHLYPEWPFAALPHINENLARRVTAALFRIEENVAAAHAMQIHGFVVPADYTPVENLLQKLRLPPFDVAPEFTVHDVWMQYRWWITAATITFGLILLLGYRLWLLNYRLRAERWRGLQQQQRLQESEYFLDTIVEYIPNMLFVKDAKNLNFVRFNNAGERLLGYAREELIGKNDYDFFPKEQADFFTSKDREIIVGKKLVDIPEESINTKSSGLRYLHTKKIPIFSDDGSPCYLLGISEDITERKQADEALKKSEARLRLEVARMPIGYIIWDKDFCVESWNPAAEKIFGFSFDEAKGRHPYELIVPAEAQLQVDDIWRRLLAGDESAYSLNENRTKDGRSIICEWTNTPLKKPDGTFLGVMAMVQDVTERMRAEEEIKVLNRELEQRVAERTADLEAANKELEAFSYSVSHDLRTPLRAINGFAHILMEDYAGKLDDEGKRLLNVVQANTCRMGQLIDDILKFSRMGRVEITVSEIDMEKLAHEVFAELSPALATGKLQLEIEPLPPVMGDIAMMRQVFVNLLSNAIKFCANKEFARIRVGSSIQKNEVIYFVKDNGAGFDMQYADKLFGVFQRLHAANEFEGTGIGLAIVKRTVSRHGGRVWAEGKVNEGATIYFAFPASALTRKIN